MSISVPGGGSYPRLVRMLGTQGPAAASGIKPTLRLGNHRFSGEPTSQQHRYRGLTSSPKWDERRSRSHLAEPEHKSTLSFGQHLEASRCLC